MSEKLFECLEKCMKCGKKTGKCLEFYFRRLGTMNNCMLVHANLGKIALALKTLLQIALVALSNLKIMVQLSGNFS